MQRPQLSWLRRKLELEPLSCKHFTAGTAKTPGIEGKSEPAAACAHSGASWVVVLARRTPPHDCGLEKTHPAEMPYSSTVPGGSSGMWGSIGDCSHALIMTDADGLDVGQLDDYWKNYAHRQIHDEFLVWLNKAVVP